MRSNALLQTVFAGFFFALTAIAPAPAEVIPTLASAGVETYVVQGGDTLSKIAAQKLDSASRYGEICRLNRLSDCDRINIGQKLTIPVIGSEKPKKQETQSSPLALVTSSDTSVPVTVTETIPASEDTVDWHHIGVDTVVPKNWHLGGTSGQLEMTSRQGQLLLQLGLAEEEVNIVSQNLSSGKCSIASRDEGHIWKGGMGFGSGYWASPTKNSIGETVNVWACPEINGKQVDFPKCGNPAVNIVTPTPPPAMAEAPTDERTPLCMMQGMEFAQGGIGTNYDGHNAVVAMELACLRKVGDRWEMGPMMHFGRGWFHEEDAKGRSNGLHFGGRFRYTAEDGSVFKFDVALGPGSLLASGHNGEWKIEKFGGLDLWLAPQWEKCWATGTCLEVMGYATVPLTGRLGDVTGDGWVNEDGATRVWTAGVLARLSHDFGWFFVPEVTAGVMAQEDVDTLGIPLKVGVRTRDRAWRAWAGMELWQGDTFIFGLEHNWGGKALYLDGKGRLEELENGQQVSIDTPVDLNQGNPKTETVVATSRKTKSRVASSWTPPARSSVEEAKGVFADVSFDEIVSARVKDPAPSTPEQLAKTDAVLSGPFMNW
jgi:LysM repeat protein